MKALVVIGQMKYSDEKGIPYRSDQIETLRKTAEYIRVEFNVQSL